MNSNRRRWVRVAAIGAVLVPVLIGMVGCLLFNLPPEAAFTVSAQTGQAPFTVNFSAVLSDDEDGIIVTFEWDFGDGTSGSGENVTHTYTAEGTFSVVLRVTDDDGESATNSKTIYVSPPEPEGPSASFTASPASGTSPLTVHVDASATTYGEGTISQYRWNWGDGSTGYGRTASHSYFSGGAQTYTITLTVTASDGKTDTATQNVSVTVAGGGTTVAGAPSARFDIDFPNDNDDVAPVEVAFDPEDSEADDGRTIASYTWTFGDGTSAHTIDSDPVTHVYRTDQSSEVFSVTLVVIDDDGAVDTITKTVKVYNYQPTAGFEIYDELGANTIADETDVTEQGDYVLGGTWPAAEDDPVTYNSVQTGSTTVWIRSLAPEGAGGIADWVGDPADPTTVVPQGTKSTEPNNFVDDDEANLCFDPEGQGWDKTIPYDKSIRPAGWTNAAWGIERIEINWGDTTTHNYDFYQWVMNGEGLFMHTYAMPATDTTAQYTITVTAHDFLGAQDSYSRTITLKKGN